MSLPTSSDSAEGKLIGISIVQRAVAVRQRHLCEPT